VALVSKTGDIIRITIFFHLLQSKENDSGLQKQVTNKNNFAGLVTSGLVSDVACCPPV
jgi:hypothetical protein